MSLHHAPKAGPLSQLHACSNTLLIALRCQSLLSSRHHSNGFSATSISRHEMENLFINALARAGTCHRHGYWGSSSYRQAPRSMSIKKELYTQVCFPAKQTRHLHGITRSGSRQQLAVSNDITRDQYLSMLDYYRESIFSLEEDAHDSYALYLPETKPWEDSEALKEPVKVLNTSGEKEALERLLEAIENQECPNDKLFEYYATLPSPGVRYIPQRSRRVLLSRLSTMPKKSEKETLRYLSLVDDMKSAGLPLNKAEWNSAIHLAGRCLAKITASEVEKTLRIWKEMEEEAGVRSNTVTFSILFDIATKAGQFPLAEMIFKEMKRRNLRISRFTRVGLIYYHGLKGDGDEIRRAYRELVEAGEIVDTTVLNCVIASLLRAGEPNAAEQVFERMKNMFAKQSGEMLSTGLNQPPNNRRDSKELARKLDRFIRQYKDHPTHLKALQDEQSLTPNTHTFVILLEHHVSATGELHRIAQLLDDMQALQVPIHGRLFMELFRGFACHGGVRYTSWTRTRLSDVWKAYLKLRDEGIQDVYVGKWMVIWVIRAFARCSTREQTLEIWEELKSRWKAESGEMDVALDILDTELGGGSSDYGE